VDRAVWNEWFLPEQHTAAFGFLFELVGQRFVRRNRRTQDDTLDGGDEELRRALTGT
jgi:hypothetical protein